MRDRRSYCIDSIITYLHNAIFMPENKILELCDLSVSAPTENSNFLLNHINLSIVPGEILAVTGQNGSGKTVLLKTIMGLYTASTKSIKFQNLDITHLSVSERAKLGISLAFQQPVAFRGLTVHELLSIAATKTLRRSQFAELLESVGLEPDLYRDRVVDAKLSGGEAKRLELASVLARPSKLILLDEPEAGIDLWSFQKIPQILERLRRLRGTSIVLVTHHPTLLRLADRVIYMRAGSIEHSNIDSGELRPLNLPSEGSHE